jgi:hypothetical protein
MAICGCGLHARAVSLLLLEALFMQISWVSLTLTWPCRLCLLRVLLCMSLCYKLSPFQAHWGRWHCTRFLRPVCLFTAHMGSGSSPLSCGVFLPPPLSQAFPLMVAGCTPRLRRSLSGQAWLVYLQFQEGFPSPSLVLSVPHPFCYVSLLFLLLITQFLFFPRVGSVCPGGYTVLAQGCLWEYHLLLSSPCLHLPKPSGRRRLVARGPSGFLHLTWSGDSLHQLEVWRGQSFASSQWHCLQGVSPVSLQDFTIWSMLSAPSL